MAILGLDYCSCSSCTRNSKRNVIIPSSLVLSSTSISYALTFPAHKASSVSQFVCACVRERGRENVWPTDCVRACACQRGKNVNVTLRCITPCLMIWFAIAVSRALLLLSQCRAISSVVIAKQMEKKKKKERKLRSKWWCHPAFFQCSNVSTFL